MSRPKKQTHPAAGDPVTLVPQSSQEPGLPAAANGGANSNTLQQQQAAPDPTVRGVQRDLFIGSFEKRLASALLWARIIAFLHALSRFLAYCNLTSATAVLLGAYASNLVARDFTLVVSLLLLEAARLASASFFLHLLMRPLDCQSQSPKKIDHRKDGHYPRSRRARFISYTSQFALIIPSLILPFLSGRLHLRVPHGHKVSNLQTSLCIFYSLVLFNSLAGLLNLICSALAFHFLRKSSFNDELPQESILRYFDTVLQNARSSGLVQADDFNFLHFAYPMLGAEFRRNVQPEAVAKNHKDLIKYLYVHRVGVDFLQMYMDATDAFVQLAAVNMVGFWADRAWGVGLESEVKLPKQVLMKLVDKVQGTGQVGWAATTSIGVLASSAPQLAKELAQMRTVSTQQSLLNCLADMVDTSSNRSLTIVRTLVRLYEQLSTNEERPPRLFTDAGRTDLVRKLQHLAKHARVQRLKVQAAYLLLLMRERCRSSIIADIKPAMDAYWFQSEKEMLELLVRGHEELLDAEALQFPAAIRADRSINPPDWAKDPSGHASAGSNPTPEATGWDSRPSTSNEAPSSSTLSSTSCEG